MDEGRARTPWWDRFLLSFLGPPQIGDVNAPVAEREPDTARCSRCDRPWSEHEIVRDPGLTYSRCPS